MNRLLAPGAAWALVLAATLTAPAFAADTVASPSGAAGVSATSPHSTALAADDEEDMGSESSKADPWEETNRSIHSFNDSLDVHAFEPAARGYRSVVPEFGRDRISDFVTNLKGPRIFVDSTLAGDVDGSVVTVLRFVVNTTFGLGGLFDVGSEIGLPKTNADFGKTLASWCVEPGPYTVIPLLGPSTVRDTAGKIVDFAIDPVGWVFTPPLWAGLTESVADGVSQREKNLETVAELKRGSIDYYAGLRSAWLQHRQKEVEERVKFLSPSDTKAD